MPGGRLLLGIVAAGCCAGAAQAAALKPPVIKEVFTLLPCPKGSAKDSTIGQEGCAEHMIVTADKQIDALAKQIFGQLQDNAARKRFVAGENAWFAYRAAFCNSQSDIFEGGSQSPVEDAQCQVGVSQDHLAALTEFHKDLGPH